MWGQVAAVAAVVGVILSFGAGLVHVTFRSGRLDARIEELEKWRTAVRGDMHEVSDELKALTLEVRKLATIIEERTERRVTFRGDKATPV
jgi:hypothetical protein